MNLLVCGHYYRAKQAAMHAAEATVYDSTGMLIMADASEQPPAAAAAGG